MENEELKRQIEELIRKVEVNNREISSLKKSNRNLRYHVGLHWDEERETGNGLIGKVKKLDERLNAINPKNIITWLVAVVGGLTALTHLYRILVLIGGQ
jgi:predicted RNase H-like nuclease (RuvC/YqgF family)